MNATQLTDNIWTYQQQELKAGI